MQSKHFMLIVIVLGVVDGIIVGALVGVFAGPAVGVGVGLAAALFPILLVPLVVALMLPITGWSTLARLYPEAEPPSIVPGATGDRGRLTSISIRARGLRMNNCVRVRADEDHLHLSLVVPTFRRVPSISLPWAAVESIVVNRRDAQLRLFEGPSMWVAPKFVEDEVRVREAIAAQQGESEPVS